MFTQPLSGNGRLLDFDIPAFSHHITIRCCRPVLGLMAGFLSISSKKSLTGFCTTFLLSGIAFCR
jgi:hypothetical protein